MRIQFSYIYSYTCKCVFCKPELSVLRFAPARIYISSDEYIYYFSPRQVPSAYPVLIFIFLLNVNWCMKKYLFFYMRTCVLVAGRCVSAGGGSESVCGQARGRARLRAGWLWNCKVRFGASRQATEMHSFEEKLDPSDVNGTMDFGLWPLAFGLWPLACLWGSFSKSFQLVSIYASSLYIYMCLQMCFLYKEL